MKIMMSVFFKSSYRVVIAAVLCLCSLYVSYGNTDRDGYRVYYEAKYIDIDTSLADNASVLDSLMRYLGSLQSDSAVQITHIHIYGYASPIGSYQYNVRHVDSRLNLMKRYIADSLSIADSLFYLHNKGVAWDQLRDMVDTSDMAKKDTILAVLDKEPVLLPYIDTLLIDRRFYELRQIDSVRSYLRLKRLFFEKLQYILVADIHYKRYIPFDELPDDSEFIPLAETTYINRAEGGTEDSCEELSLIPLRQMSEHTPVDLWQQKLHIKSNGIGWLMLAGNGAVEIELTRHWSINLPVYYSGLDYFSREVKFKVLTIQPEVRYWFLDGRNWYAGAHLGIGWYNYALNGEYRIQDCGWDSPALGGGFSGGYRMPLTSNGRWQVEFSLGVGVYAVKYDKFRNEPGGLIAETVDKVWFGIDQAAVSFIYSIGLDKWTR